jgi:hypothetical protein
MAFLLHESMQGKLIEVTVSDRLTKETYQAFNQWTKAAIRRGEPVSVLFVILGFRGWDVGAQWEDIDLDWKHLNYIERLAIVGEAKWKRGMQNFCRPFTAAIISYFEQTDLERARDWISESAELIR